MVKLNGNFCREIVKPEIWPLLDPADPVSLNKVTADGVDSDGFIRTTTSKLRLYFNTDIPGLVENNITLTNVTANMIDDGNTVSSIAKVSLYRVDVGVYDLYVTGIIGSGTVVVSVSVQDVTISNDTHRVLVYRAYNLDTTRLALITDSLGNITLTVPGPLLIKPFPLLGVWQWIDPIDTGATISNMYARIKFYELNGVTEVYYCTYMISSNPNMPIIERLGTSADNNSDGINQWNRIRKFIGAANLAGIKTFILISDNGGDNVWTALPYTRFNELVTNYAAYQSDLSTSPEQKFSGLHLDFENYIAVDHSNSVAMTAALQDLTNFLIYAQSNYNNVVETIDFDVACSIGVQYSVLCNNSTILFAEAAFNKVDRIFAMSYSNTGDGTYNLAKGDGWLDTFINPGNKSVMFGAETQDLTGWYEDSENDTYYGSGKILLNTQMGILRSIADGVRMDINSTGLSIHMYADTWMNLATDAS